MGLCDTVVFSTCLLLALPLLPFHLPRLSPQRALGDRAPLPLVPLSLRAGLPLHDLHIMLKGHLLLLKQALHGQAGEEGRGAPHIQTALVCIDEEGHRLACQALRDVVGVQVKFDTAIRAHQAHKGLLVKVLEPAVGLHDARRWRQCRQNGTGDRLQLIATRSALMGSLFIGMMYKRFGDLAHFLQRSGMMHQQTFLLGGAVVPFHNSLDAIDISARFRLADWSG
jgi:hypothetical protein